MKDVNVGDRLYTYRPSSNYYVSAVRDPYTVVSVKGNTMIARAAMPVFNGPRYFDSLPSKIVEDPNGRILKFRWSAKKNRWQESPCGSYPRVAVIGEWDYFPYVD